jgi:hypothetical protein
MSTVDWEKDEHGKAVVFPFVAYETLVAHGPMCAFRAHYIEYPEQLLSGQSSNLPLIMRPEMARQLAAALIRCADEAEVGPTGVNGH